MATHHSLALFGPQLLNTIDQLKPGVFASVFLFHQQIADHYKEIYVEENLEIFILFPVKLTGRPDDNIIVRSLRCWWRLCLITVRAWAGLKFSRRQNLLN